MSQEFILNATVREDVGKGASRRLRREHGLIPAIVYGAGKAPVMLTMKHDEVLHAQEHEAFYASILTLKIEGKKTPEKVVVKAMQRHPFKPKLLHLDFLRVKANVELVKNIPLHLINEENAKGVKAGGQIQKSLNEIEVSCLPKYLPEYIEVDMAEVELDQIVHLSDIKLPEGVSLTQLSGDEPHDLAVASIHEPKQQAEPEVESTEEAAGSEGAGSDSDKADDAK